MKEIYFLSFWYIYIRMKEIYFSFTLYTYFSTQSPFTATHFFFICSIHLFIPYPLVHSISTCSFRPWRKFLVRCWSICAQLPQLCHPMKNVDLLTPLTILGTTISLTAPNLGCKEGAEPLWISGLSWLPEFVHCTVTLRCRAAWFCGCVAWMIVRLHSKKGKAVPLQALSGPEGSRKLRFPDFVKTAQDAGVALRVPGS